MTASPIFTVLLFLNESVFITINNFLLLPIVNILTILLVEWEIAGLVDKWTVCISINEQILQHMMDSSYNWKNIATIFINAAMDKEVLQ